MFELHRKNIHKESSNMKRVDVSFISGWVKKVKAVKLLGGKCTVCGNSDVTVMEFHHVMEKNIGVSYLIRGDRRWSKIEEEIKKCVLMCSNCHREIDTVENSRSELLKRKLLEYKNVKCCEKCGYVGKNLNSLDFHHIDANSKKFKVMYESNRRKNILKYITDEVDKCLVMCANCHVKEHINIDRLEVNWDFIVKGCDSYKEMPKIDKDIVIKMYNDGVKQIEIARKLRCAKSSISYIVNRYCV